MSFLKKLFGPKRGEDASPRAGAAAPGTPARGPTFRALGIAVCRNNNCTYKPDPEIVEFFGHDNIGPEFTIQERGGGFYVVCTSCGTVERGPLSRSDAMQIVTLASKISGV